MILEVDIQVKGVEALSKSEVNGIFKEAYHLTGQRWRRIYLPLHFGRSASRRYGYTLRSGRQNSGLPKRGSYTARKLAFVGHTRPLEYTGEGKRQALSQENISATSKKVVVRLPRKFNWRPAKGQVRMADEIRATRPEEIASLTAFMVDHLRKTFRQSGASGATVIGRTRTL